MGLPDPRKRKPTASEVAAWARSRIGKDLMSMDIMAHNVGICPTIYSKGIGVFTTGNAIAMAWYRYPRGFKFYRNTASFVPKPGDFAVWGQVHLITAQDTQLWL